MKLGSILGRLALLVGLLTLVGCTSPYKTPELRSRPPGQEAFPGIAQLTAQHRTVDVLMVHGMCTKPPTWAEQSIRALNTALEGTGDPKIQKITFPDSKAELYQATLTLPQGTVRASALLWSPITAPLKSQLCYDQTNKSELCEKAPEPDRPPYPYDRAKLNRAIKDTLLNDCLADALIYQGKSRNAIIAQFQHIIVNSTMQPSDRAARADAFRVAANATTPLVVIANSLGSKMAFDAVYRLAIDPNKVRQAAGLQTINRMVQVFMRANQMPILALADQLLDGTPALRKDDRAYPQDPLAALIDLRQRRQISISGISDTAPRVVAFTDPNDLLSYILVPANQVASYDVVDVVVSNDPTYFGLLENPYAAHTAYDENRKVWKLITCGNPASQCETRR